MEDLILISNLNDFIFCPVSIYFHKLYGNQDNLTYQSQYQINGTKAHEKVDNKKYSTRKSVKMALTISVFAVILYAQQWSRTYSRSHRAEPALPVNMLANFFCVYCAGIFCPRT